LLFAFFLPPFFVAFFFAMDITSFRECIGTHSAAVSTIFLQKMLRAMVLYYLSAIHALSLYRDRPGSPVTCVLLRAEVDAEASSRPRLCMRGLADTQA